MLRLASDANFKGPAFRGLFLRQPDLDLVHVQDAGLRTAKDPAILAWAAAHGRILLTHDVNTVPDFAYERVRLGHPMPGVFVLPELMPIGQMIEEVLTVALCSEQDEWKDLVVHLPLRCCPSTCFPSTAKGTANMIGI